MLCPRTSKKPPQEWKVAGGGAKRMHRRPVMQGLVSDNGTGFCSNPLVGFEQGNGVIQFVF